MATGNEILNYQGNAELAAGSAGGVGGFNETAKDLNAGTQRMLGDVMQQQFRWNGMLYAQAIKDRDDTYALMAQQDIDMPVLDEDREVLQKRIDEIKNDMISTPNIRANREKFLEVQGKINDLTAMKTGAKTRYATAAKMQQAVASELNPELKSKMQAHLNEQLSKGVMHQIDPYSQTLTYDEKDLQASKTITSYLTSVDDKTGVPYRTPVTMPDPQSYTDEVRLEGLTTGEMMTRAYKIKSFFDQQTQNEMLMTPEVVKEANAKIEQFNTENKYDKTSPYYAKPLAVVDEATNSVSVQSTPIDFWKSYKVANTWEKRQGAREVDKDALEGQKKVMDIRTGYSEAGSKRITANAQMVKARADASKVPAEIEELKARAAKERNEGDKIKAETTLLEADGMQSASDAFQLFGNEALDTKGYKKIAQLPGPQKDAFNMWYSQQLGGVDSTWEIKDLGKKNAAAVKALSIGRITLEGKSGNEEVLRTITPSRVYMLRSPDGDANRQKLVGLDKDGNVMKVLDVNQAGEELMLNSAGYKRDDKFTQRMNAYRVAVERYQGNDAAGWDLDASLKLGDVVDNTPGGRNIGAVDLGGEQLRVEGDRLIDPKTRKVVAVKVNGKWVNQE